MTTQTPQGTDAPDLPGRLKQVRRRFDQWRKNRARMGPIPAKLWAAAARCAAEYGIYRTARALGLDSGKLKRQMGPGAKHRQRGTLRPPTFVEVGLTESAAPAECVVELENPSGEKMRIHLKGTAPDLAALSRSFWRGEK